MNPRRWRFCRTDSGFTLVELLVVIAIIGIMVALLLPAVQQAREAARRANCQSNLKQIGLAVLDYASAHGGDLPPGGITNGPWRTRSKESWSILVLPFLEQQNLYDQYDFDAYNEDFVNRPVLQTILPIQLCPSDEDTHILVRPQTGPGDIFEMARGSYRANAGRCGNPPKGNWDTPHNTDRFGPDFLHWKGPFHAIGNPERGRPYQYVQFSPKLSHVTDGLANTIFFGEATSKSSTSSVEKLVNRTLRRRTFWAYSNTHYNKSCVYPETRAMLGDHGRCVEVGGPSGTNACHRAWNSLHPGGLHFCFGDGSVRFHDKSIDMEILAERATMAGDELVR